MGAAAFGPLLAAQAGLAGASIATDTIGAYGQAETQKAQVGYEKDAVDAQLKERTRQRLVELRKNLSAQRAYFGAATGSATGGSADAVAAADARETGAQIGSDQQMAAIEKTGLKMRRRLISNEQRNIPIRGGMAVANTGLMSLLQYRTMQPASTRQQ